jgi:putative photosynthetic complex assembly protein 2
MNIPDFLYPATFVLLVWWFSTGAILYLDQLPRHTYPVSMSGATAVAVGALMLLAVGSHQTTLTSAYSAFTAAILLWGWHEMAFLMGFVTGSRKQACPPHASEWRRFLAATEAIIHHELALVATVVVLFAATWTQPNQLGAYTFFALWVMRLSAKLNLFFGVRNRYESFLPEQLAYMHTYFGKRTINWLFPVVVSAGTVAAFLLWQRALAPGADTFEHAAYTMLATLLSLAVLEHWFLVIPLNVERMWNWAMRNKAAL